MTKITDMLDLWVQEQINTACRGLFDRLDRLEVQRLRDEDAIRDLYRQVENQNAAVNTLSRQVLALEDYINTIANGNLALTKRLEDLENYCAAESGVPCRLI